MTSSYAFKSRVRTCLYSVVKSTTLCHRPLGSHISKRTPSPTVKEMHYTRLKAQKDLFLFLPQTERFSSGSSSMTSTVRAEI